MIVHATLDNGIQPLGPVLTRQEPFLVVETAAA
jgi:hypothetical protein